MSMRNAGETLENLWDDKHANALDEPGRFAPSRDGPDRRTIGKTSDFAEGPRS